MTTSFMTMMKLSFQVNPKSVSTTKFLQVLGDSLLSHEVFSGVWFELLPMELWVGFMTHYPIMTQGEECDSKRRLAILKLLHQEYKDLAAANLFRSNSCSHVGGALLEFTGQRRMLPLPCKP